MPSVVEESWDLTSGDITSIPATSTYRADGTASTWSDIWKYQVPTGTAHILKPSHHFSIYLDTATGTESDIGITRVRISVRDQSEGDSKVVFGPTVYISCRDFDDVTKMAKLDLTSDFAVEEAMWIIIEVYHTSSVKYDYSYFNLEMIRIRSTI